jgi:DNA-binding SARP family transcriptional activator
MDRLHLAVLGPPEVLHDGSRLSFALRKALALLVYLAVEGGMHPRGKLAALLWPDSEPHAARTALRNALALLRSLLADASAAPAAPSHLLSERELVGLNPQAPLELDLDVVHQAYTQAQLHSTLPTESQRAALVAQFQQALALARGPFLDGFWLGEDTPFDAWVKQQQQQWQVRVQLLCERLSSWQEAAGELEQARATLNHWLALDPLQEEAYLRLMRVQLALGDASAAWQVYATCQARLAEALRVKPAADTVALAERIRATAAARRGNSPARPSTVTTARSRPTGELAAPLVGRAAAFSQLVGRYQQAQQGQPQVVLVVGEAGIGKTRLAHEFAGWARAQGADVLSGQTFETRGQLPYQPLVEALRPRLEEENAPEELLDDLLDDLWLAELARLLPELRVRCPDLPAPTEDELAATVRLFEAVARLLDALAQRAPLVLLLDDLHWMDGASLDLLRYLGRFWSRHDSRVLLLGTVRRDGLELKSQLSAQLVDLGRDVPVSQVSLQPLYLLETLKLLREREWLVPRPSADGTWRLEPSVEMTAAVLQEQSRRGLVPPAVRALIQARLAQLSPGARQLVLASAVLGTQATAEHLWQVAELGVQAGVEALEEAVGSGLLREEAAGMGRPGSYRFAHQLMREVVYTELGEARRQVLHRRALELLYTGEARSSELAYPALLAGEAAIISMAQQARP